MEQLADYTPSVSYYDRKYRMQITIISGREITLKEAEAEIAPVLKEHYMNRMLAIPKGDCLK